MPRQQQQQQQQRRRRRRPRCVTTTAHLLMLGTATVTSFSPLHRKILTSGKREGTDAETAHHAFVSNFLLTRKYPQRKDDDGDGDGRKDGQTNGSSSNSNSQAGGNSGAAKYSYRYNGPQHPPQRPPPPAFPAEPVPQQQQQQSYHPQSYRPQPQPQPQRTNVTHPDYAVDSRQNEEPVLDSNGHRDPTNGSRQPQALHHQQPQLQQTQQQQQQKQQQTQEQQQTRHFQQQTQQRPINGRYSERPVKPRASTYSNGFSSPPTVISDGTDGGPPYLNTLFNTRTEDSWQSKINKYTSDLIGMTSDESPVQQQNFQVDDTGGQFGRSTSSSVNIEHPGVSDFAFGFNYLDDDESVPFFMKPAVQEALQGHLNAYEAMSDVEREEYGIEYTNDNPNDNSVNGHAPNGHVSGNNSTDGYGPNTKGYNTNEHLNGNNSTDGYSAPRHIANGHTVSGHVNGNNSTDEYSANAGGYTANGHSTNAYTANGHVNERNSVDRYSTYGHVASRHTVNGHVNGNNGADRYAAHRHTVNGHVNGNNSTDGYSANTNGYTANGHDKGSRSANNQHINSTISVVNVGTVAQGNAYNPNGNRAPIANGRTVEPANAPVVQAPPNGFVPEGAVLSNDNPDEVEVSTPESGLFEEVSILKSTVSALTKVVTALSVDLAKVVEDTKQKFAAPPTPSPAATATQKKKATVDKDDSATETIKKFELNFGKVLENQLEITKQLGMSIAELRGIQEQQGEFIQVMAKNDIEMTNMLSAVRDDISDLKGDVVASKQYQSTLDKRLQSLEAKMDANIQRIGDAETSIKKMSDTKHAVIEADRLAGAGRPVINANITGDERIVNKTIRESDMSNKTMSQRIQDHIKDEPTAVVNELEDKFVPFTDDQQSVVSQREQSLNVPTFRVRREIAMDRFEGLYQKLKSRGISVTALLAKAVALAVKENPIMNSSYDADGGGLLYKKDINVTVAVATGGGMITPTIHFANMKNLTGIAAAWRDLVQKAKLGTLTDEEREYGTITITNLSMYGVSNFDALLEPEQGTVVAIGATYDKFSESNESQTGYVTTKAMTVTVACDHRQIYGADAAVFLASLADIMETRLGDLLR